MAERVVNLNGVEHHFPDTFTDDQIATALKNYGTAPPMTRSVLGHPLSASDETPTATQKLVSGFADNPLIQGAAHPQTTGDFLSLLLPAGVEGAITAGKAYGSAAKEALSAGGPLKQLPGRMLGVLRQRVQDATTGVTRGADMYAMPRAASVVDRAPQAAQMIGEAAPSNVTDMSQWVRPSQLTPEQLRERVWGGRPFTGQLRPANPTRFVAPTPAVAEPMAAAASKPFFSAQDIARIRDLMGQGLSQEKAIETVTNLPQAFRGLPTDTQALDALTTRARTGQWQK